jgi:hypothetical protein
VTKEAKQVAKANECVMITQVRVTKHIVIATLKETTIVDLIIQLHDILHYAQRKIIN